MAEENINLGTPRFTPEEKNCDKNPTPYPYKLGDCSYYKWRFENFLERHKDCKHTPPVYYFGPLRQKSWDFSNEAKTQKSIPRYDNYDPELIGQNLRIAKEAQDKYYNTTLENINRRKAEAEASSDFYTINNLKEERIKLEEHYKLVNDNFAKFVERERWFKWISEIEELNPPYPEYPKGIPIVNESYGYKYCTIFSKILYYSLSNQGKAWLIETRKLLQLYIEKGLIEKKLKIIYNIRYRIGLWTKLISLEDIELDSDSFQQFAFSTHPDAYIDAGIIDLDIGDKYIILRTPELGEWVDWKTIEQAVYVGGIQLGSWAKDGGLYIYNIHKELAIKSKEFIIDKYNFFN